MNVATQIDQIKEAHEKLNKKDLKAKNLKLLKGRYVQEQVGTGYGYYEIIRVNKDTVVIKHIEIKHSYMHPVYGAEAKIPKEYAERNIAFRDHWTQSLKV